MKILIVVGIFPPDIGGPATFVPLIAKKLVENNYQIEVICLSDSLNHNDNNFDFSVHRIKRRQSLIKRWIKTVLKIISGDILQNIWKYILDGGISRGRAAPSPPHGAQLLRDATTFYN